MDTARAGAGAGLPEQVPEHHRARLAALQQQIQVLLSNYQVRRTEVLNAESPIHTTIVYLCRNKIEYIQTESGFFVDSSKPGTTEPPGEDNKKVFVFLL